MWTACSEFDFQKIAIASDYTKQDFFKDGRKDFPEINSNANYSLGFPYGKQAWIT